MLPIFSRIKTWWNAADRTQRTVTVGGIGGLLLLLVATAMFATRTRYETLVAGVQPMERGQMVEALALAGIQAQSDDTGVVEVPAGQKENALLALAKSGKLPKSGNWGLDELGKIGLGTSKGLEDETIRAVLEGRIGGMIEKMEGVSSATVLLTQPREHVFADAKEHPTASVTIAEDGSGGLSRKDGRTIAALVSKAVAGMAASDVVVTSTSGGVLWDGSDVAAGGGSKSEMDEQESRFWEEKIQTKLDRVYGPNNTQVIASADLDMSHVVTDDHIVTPTERPTSVQNVNETATGRGGGAAAGISGVVANQGRGAPSQATDPKSVGGNYANTGATKIYDTTTQDRHTVGAIGDLKGLSLSIVVNSDKISDPAPVQKIVNGVLGGRIKTDDKGVPLPNQAFVADVTSQKFDGTAAAAAKAAADATASAHKTQQIVSLLPIGAILIVALLVAKQVGKISRSVLPASTQVETVHPLAEGVVYEALPAAEGGLSNVLATLDAGAEAGPEAETIKDRVNLPLESIKKMAADRPEMVATLIKSMMLGEKS